MAYLEQRLDSIEARIDDLCGLIGELVERIDRGLPVSEIDSSPPMDLTIPPGLWDDGR